MTWLVFVPGSCARAVWFRGHGWRLSPHSPPARFTAGCRSTGVFWVAHDRGLDLVHVLGHRALEAQKDSPAAKLDPYKNHDNRFLWFCFFLRPFCRGLKRYGRESPMEDIHGRFMRFLGVWLISDSVLFTFSFGFGRPTWAQAAAGEPDCFEVCSGDPADPGRPGARCRDAYALATNAFPQPAAHRGSTHLHRAFDTIGVDDRLCVLIAGFTAR